MSKTIFFTIALVIGLLSSTAKGTILQLELSLPILQTCGLNEYQTPSGCWSSCSSPQYNTCADFFPLLYNPSFCAYTEDGRYISYTYECQACKSAGVVAVRNGACDCSFVKCGSNQECQDGQCVDLISINPVDLCLNIRCPFGSYCQNGECLPDTTLIAPIDKCAVIRCMQGYYCQNGQCIKQAGYCGAILCAPGFICQNGRCLQLINLCATVRCSAGYFCRGGQCVFDPLQQPICQARRLTCAYPRPDENTCPTLNYFVAPTPNYCGITFYGQQINFSEECDACKDTSIQYYWNKSCDQITPCLSTKPIISLPPVDLCADIICIATATCIGGICVPISENLAGNLLRI